MATLMSINLYLNLYIRVEIGVKMHWRAPTTDFWICGSQKSDTHHQCWLYCYRNKFSKKSKKKAGRKYIFYEKVATSDPRSASVSAKRLWCSVTARTSSAFWISVRCNNLKFQDFFRNRK